MKDVQCYELFGGIAHNNHAFSFFMISLLLFYSMFLRIVCVIYVYYMCIICAVRQVVIHCTSCAFCEQLLTCGTVVPLWLKLDNVTMPAENGHEISAKACGSGPITVINCCAQQLTDVTVRSCGTFYIYYLRPAKYCSLAYCTVKQN